MQRYAPGVLVHWPPAQMAGFSGHKIVDRSVPFLFISIIIILMDYNQSSIGLIHKRLNSFVIFCVAKFEC